MKDIQPSSSLSRPAGATTASVTPSDSALTRCFNELLGARNEVSWTMDVLELLLNLRQIATMNGFANSDDLVHKTSIHHLSLLTVEGEYSIFY